MTKIIPDEEIPFGQNPPETTAEEILASVSVNDSFMKAVEYAVYDLKDVPLKGLGSISEVIFKDQKASLTAAFPFLYIEKSSFSSQYFLHFRSCKARDVKEYYRNKKVFGEDITAIFTDISDELGLHLGSMQKQIIELVPFTNLQYSLELQQGTPYLELFLFPQNARPVFGSALFRKHAAPSLESFTSIEKTLSTKDIMEELKRRNMLDQLSNYLRIYTGDLK